MVIVLDGFMYLVVIVVKLLGLSDIYFWIALWLGQWWFYLMIGLCYLHSFYLPMLCLFNDGTVLDDIFECFSHASYYDMSRRLEIFLGLILLSFMWVMLSFSQFLTLGSPTLLLVLDNLVEGYFGHVYFCRLFCLLVD